MHCFASENQIYEGTVIFGVESLKGQENPLLKNLQLKRLVENVRFLSWRAFFCSKVWYSKHQRNGLLKGLKLYASFRFPAIRFDAPTLLSFSGCTHAYAKCPPVRTRLVDSLFCITCSLENNSFCSAIRHECCLILYT